MGCKEGTGGVGVAVSRSLECGIVDVNRVSERMMMVKIALGKVVLNIVSVYAPQVGRPLVEKEDFYNKLDGVLSGIREDERVVLCGDFNGHVGEQVEGFEGVHGGKGFGTRNEEGEMLLEFADSRSLVISNTWFDKEETKKVSYESGGARTVVDYVLVRKSERANVLDVKVIPSEPCILQHKLMVCQVRVREQVRKRRGTFVSKCKVWRFESAEAQKEFGAIVQARDRTRDRSGGSVEKVWKEFRDCLVDGANEVCGRTKGPPQYKESWLRNEEVAAAVREKRRMYLKMKESKKGDDKQRVHEDSLAYSRSKNTC